MTTTTFKWTVPAAAVNLLTTELNNISNGAYTAVGAEYDNTSGLYTHGNFMVYLASLTPAAGGYVSVFLLAKVDGSNLPDGGGAVVPGPETFLFSVGTLSTGAGVKRRTVTGIPIPPCKFSIVALNGTGVSTAATGSTVTMHPFYLQAV